MSLACRGRRELLLPHGGARAPPKDRVSQLLILLPHPPHPDPRPGAEEAAPTALPGGTAHSALRDPSGRASGCRSLQPAREVWPAAGCPGFRLLLLPVQPLNAPPPPPPLGAANPRLPPAAWERQRAQQRRQEERSRPAAPVPRAAAAAALD